MLTYSDVSEFDDQMCCHLDKENGQENLAKGEEK